MSALMTIFVVFQNEIWEVSLTMPKQTLISSTTSTKFYYKPDRWAKKMENLVESGSTVFCSWPGVQVVASSDDELKEHKKHENKI